VLTVATAVLDDDHVPPVAVLVSVKEAPGQSGVAPLIVPASGKAFTVAFLVAVAVPQLLVTL
jgi:hypothetical protein